VDMMRSEVVVKNTSWIANNQQNIVINFHQDFAASKQNDFFTRIGIGAHSIRLIILEKLH